MELEDYTSNTTETVNTPVNNGSSTTAPVQQKNTLAIVALILGIFVAPAGIICGAIALKKAKAMGGVGKGMALAGLIIGILEIVAAVVVVAVVIIVVVVLGKSFIDGISGAGALLALLALLALVL